VRVAAFVCRCLAETVWVSGPGCQPLAWDQEAGVTDCFSRVPGLRRGGDSLPVVVMSGPPSADGEWVPFKRVILGGHRGFPAHCGAIAQGPPGARWQ